MRHRDLVKNALKENGNDVVYDRMMIGSYVYAKVKNDEYNQNGVTMDELLQWTLLIADLQGVIIHAYAPQEVLIKRLQERGDDYINEDELLHADRVYAAIFEVMRQKSYMPILRYNSSTQTPEAFIRDHRAALRAGLFPRSAYGVLGPDVRRRKINRLMP